MNRSNNLLAELQRLASLSDVHGSLDTHLCELTTTAARLLSAESCTFMWLSTEQSAVDAPASSDTSDPWSVASGDVLCAPIRSSGRVMGLVHVRGPIDRPSFDGDDFWLLKIVTVYIGKSLHAKQLQNLLHSRFAQIALAQSVDDTVGRVLAVVPHPGRIVKILAKSFYLEMTKAGFGTKEIINAASQIISELSASLKRHAKRRDGSPSELPNARPQLVRESERRLPASARS
jgi:hypothetical protein